MTVERTKQQRAQKGTKGIKKRGRKKRDEGTEDITFR